MSIAPERSPFETLADVLHRLGDIPTERIPAVPPPGTATEADVLRRPDGGKRLYELVDRVLVEKPMGMYESRLALVLGRLLDEYAERHGLGIVVGPDAPHRLVPGLVRLPDVSVLLWERLPGRRIPAERVPDLAPDLAVEVLSEGNTEAEMERKREEYFAAGTQCVWLADWRVPEVRVYTSPTEFTRMGADGVLEGDPVLPGFRLPLQEWLDRAGHSQRMD